MPVEETLNRILKEMWRIDEKAVLGSELTEEEREFYNQNLSVIAEYYDSNAAYWASKQPL